MGPSRDSCFRLTDKSRRQARAPAHRRRSQRALTPAKPQKLHKITDLSSSREVTMSSTFGEVGPRLISDLIGEFELRKPQ
ncbi:hypothetical protein KY290_032013 [Solanum tuberosum]|uniref:Uncharacterized protein n=1 Tax=Solanum tuberosum TaxID=4113 RepID=A0ABQ7UEC8_SOLTU|nr:hypothetical protein KY290_032013 [Solanum tuberosum]